MYSPGDYVYIGGESVLRGLDAVVLEDLGEDGVYVVTSLSTFGGRKTQLGRHILSRDSIVPPLRYSDAS